jgi:hypothetical protein
VKPKKHAKNKAKRAVIRESKVNPSDISGIQHEDIEEESTPPAIVANHREHANQDLSKRGDTKTPTPESSLHIRVSR